MLLQKYQFDRSSLIIVYKSLEFWIAWLWLWLWSQCYRAVWKFTQRFDNMIEMSQMLGFVVLQSVRPSRFFQGGTKRLSFWSNVYHWSLFQRVPAFVIMRYVALRFEIHLMFLNFVAILIQIISNFSDFKEKLFFYLLVLLTVIVLHIFYCSETFCLRYTFPFYGWTELIRD